MASFAATSLSAGVVHSATQRLSRSRAGAPFRRPQVPRIRKLSPSVTRAGLLDGLFAPASPPSRPSGKAAELVSEILELTEGTNAGAELDPSTKAQVEELAEGLVRFRPRAPTKSPLFWGEYEVLYCTNPNAPGGPLLRSGPGQALARDQKLRQTLMEPGTLINSVEFKSFGLLPGKAQQEAELQVLDGNRYKITLNVKGEATEREFEVLYLDDQLRVVRYEPEDREAQLFIFRRIAEEEEQEEEEDEEDEEPAAKAKSGGFDLGSLLVKPRESLATQAERAYADEAGTSRRAASRPAPRAAKAAPPPPPKAPSKEEIARQRAAAAAEASARKEAEAKQREVVKKQLANLQAAYKAAQDEAREATKEFKEAEREASGTLRAAKPSRSLLDRFQAEAEAAEAQIAEAREAAAAYAKELQEATSRLKEAEKALRR